MRAIINATFRLSRDGIRIERVKAGSVEEIPDALFSGLEAAGYVSGHNQAAPAAAQESAEEGDLDLVVKHAGGGRWWLVRGDERVKGPFPSKAEAEAAR